MVLIKSLPDRSNEGCKTVTLAMYHPFARDNTVFIAQTEPTLRVKLDDFVPAKGHHA